LAAAAVVARGLAPGPAIQFEEVGHKAGLLFQLKNGETGKFHQIELMGGGVAVLDYNNDGCADVFFTNGAAIPSLKKSTPEFSNRLYRNNCDMTFTDVTKEAGVAGEGYSMAAAAGDFDNDGFTDLFVAGVDRNILYRNRGDGHFEEVTDKAGVGGGRPKPWSVSSGWVDYDNDGWLDLFVTNYVAWDAASEPHCGNGEQPFYCHPSQYRGLPNQLFHNNHDGTFTDVSVKSGIGAHVGKGMGVAFADMDGDGLTDIFVANDSMRSFLFHNEGGGRFREIGLEAGVALRDDGAAIAGMGADWRDLNNDGHPDVAVSGMINDGFLLFRNLGGGRGFEDDSERSGLAIGTRQFTGWGLGLYDFDNDGWKDVFFAMAHFTQLGKFLGRDAALANRVFRNDGGGRLVDVSASAGGDFQRSALNRGVAFADFDNDGRIDAVVSCINGPAKFFRNVTGGGAHWLAVKLRGVKANRQGLGAKVRMVLPDGRKLYNHATTAVGYGSSSEALVRFGLGRAGKVERLEIEWPDGGKQEMRDVTGDRVVEVVESTR
jgi:hypothetical protein